MKMGGRRSWKDVASGFLGRCITQTIYEPHVSYFSLLEIKDGNEFHRKSKNKGAEFPQELRPLRHTDLDDT